MTLEQMVEKGRQLIAADRADTPPIYIYTDPFPESESRNDYINNRNYKTESLERFNLMYHAANNRITQNPDKVTLHRYIQPRNVQHDRLRIGTWLHALKTKTMKRGGGVTSTIKFFMPSTSFHRERRLCRTAMIKYIIHK